MYTHHIFQKLVISVLKFGRNPRNTHRSRQNPCLRYAYYMSWLCTPRKMKIIKRMEYMIFRFPIHLLSIYMKYYENKQNAELQRKNNFLRYPWHATYHCVLLFPTIMMEIRIFQLSTPWSKGDFLKFLWTYEMGLVFIDITMPCDLSFYCVFFPNLNNGNK